MTNDLIIPKAIEEIEERNFGTTKQLLDIHEVVHVNGKPLVLRVDKEQKDGTVVVYFPIKDGKFL